MCSQYQQSWLAKDVNKTLPNIEIWLWGEKKKVAGLHEMPTWDTYKELLSSLISYFHFDFLPTAEKKQGIMFFSSQ